MSDKIEITITKEECRDAQAMTMRRVSAQEMLDQCMEKCLALLTDAKQMEYEWWEKIAGKYGLDMESCTYTVNAATGVVTVKVAD